MGLGINLGDVLGGATVLDSAFFHLAEHPMSAKGLASEFYCDANDEINGKLLKLNGLSPRQSIHPGKTLVIPSRRDLLSSNMDKLSHFADAHGRGSSMLKPRAAKLVNDHAAVLGGFMTADNFAGVSQVALESLGGVAGYVNDRTKLATRTLGKINEAYVTQLAKKGSLSAPEFKAQLGKLGGDLNAQLNGYARSAVAKNPSATSVKSVLGISHKRALNTFKAGGNTTQLREVSKAINVLGNIGSKAEKVGNFAQVVSLGMSTYSVHSAFSEKGMDAGSQTLGKESSRLLGGTIGGALGSQMAVGALTLMVGTGGLGIPVIAAGLIGGVALGMVGQELGEAGWNSYSAPLSNKVGEAIEWFGRAGL